MKSKNYYETLGVSRSAAADDIKRAFRAQAAKHHPDRNQGDAAAPDRFRQVKAAYDVLRDPERRAAYDRELRKQQAEVRGAPVPPSPQASSKPSFQWSPETPVISPPAHPAPKSSTNWGEVAVVGIAAVGFGALLGALFGDSSTTWDSNTQRHRGPDGRFKSG